MKYKVGDLVVFEGRLKGTVVGIKKKWIFSKTQYLTIDWDFKFTSVFVNTDPFIKPIITLRATLCTNTNTTS